MSLRTGILAVLTMGECHGYQLRQEIETRTGGSWQVNIGQIYTTLDRLERDGLVTALRETSSGQTPYRITAKGKSEAKAWLQSATLSSVDTKNELAMKVALAITIPNCDVQNLIHAQRVHTMRNLQSITQAKRDVDPNDPSELAWLLIADRNIFEHEAELRWLDHIEGTLNRAQVRGLDPQQEMSEPAKRGRPARVK